MSDSTDPQSDVVLETNLDDEVTVEFSESSHQLSTPPTAHALSDEEDDVRTHSPFIPQEVSEGDTAASRRLPTYSAALRLNRTTLPPVQPPSYHDLPRSDQIGSSDSFHSSARNRTDSESSADESTNLLTAQTLAVPPACTDNERDGEVELQEMVDPSAERNVVDGELSAPPPYNMAVSRVAAGLSRPMETTFSTDVSTRYTAVDTESGDGVEGRDEPPPTYDHIAPNVAPDTPDAPDSRIPGEDLENAQSSQSSVDSNTSAASRIRHGLRRILEGRGLRASTKKLIIITCVVVSLIVLFVALFPVQFSYVQYHQFALVRTKSTGRVSTSRVYEHGCYVLGVNKEFVYLNRTIESVAFYHLSMFTQDNVDLAIDVQVYYFLQYEDIGQMWRDYAGKHETVIERAIKTTIRNCAPRLTQEDYLLKRDFVEKLLYDALTEKFANWGISIFLVNYQELYLPQRVLDKKLQLLIIKTEIDKELAYQKQREVELQTELLTTKVIYQAKEAINNGTAQAAAITSISQVQKSQHLEVAHSSALKSMMKTLNVTQMDYGLSFYYLATLNTIDHFAGSLGYSKRGLYTPKGA